MIGPGRAGPARPKSHFWSLDQRHRVGVWRRVEITADSQLRLPGPWPARTNRRTETCRTVRPGQAGPLPSTTGGAFSHQEEQPSLSLPRCTAALGVRAASSCCAAARRAIGVRASATLQCSICRPRSKAEATAAPQCAGTSPRRGPALACAHDTGLCRSRKTALHLPCSDRALASTVRRGRGGHAIDRPASPDTDGRTAPWR